MNKYIFIIISIIILTIIYYITNINNCKKKELFESEQESNTNNDGEQEITPYSLLIILGIIIMCLLCSVIYYFNTNTPIPELIQKKQLDLLEKTSQLGLTNTSDSSKPYIIIVQPSIVPFNQTQPSLSNPTNITNPIQIPNIPVQIQNSLPNYY
jgi:uncharacterized protein YpmB